MAGDAVTRAASSAPVAEANAAGGPGADDEEMPQANMTRRRWLIFGLFVLSALALLYFVLPRLAGLRDTWHRIHQGDPTWLVVAALLEVLSFGGYILLFRTVFVRGDSKIDWRESYQITMAGLAATRLFAAAGAGGVALTAWALRRSGMDARLVACRMIAFMSLLYAVYVGALVVVGVGLRTGIFSGPAPFGFTVIPAIFGAVMFTIFLAMALVPSDFERLVAGWSWGHAHPRRAKLLQRLATVPASVARGVRTAISLLRARHPGLLGALAWWGFDIAVLWACFHAFGQPPPFAVIIMAYFVGMLANTLPLPGGIGGVDGGMIGTFVAFDVSGGLAVVAVLAYRGFSFWLPTIPGAIAYLQLRKTVERWRSGRAQTGAAA